MTDDIKIGESELTFARALSTRLKRLADRLGIEPCNPEEVTGGILVYTGGEGPVYDLLEVIDALLDRIEGIEEDE